MNQLERIIGNINRLPRLLRSRALTAFVGRTVKFVGTAGVSMDELSRSRCVVSLENRKRVQNHIGSVHAVASALLVETATGFVVGMNVPDSAIPVIKTMKLDYVKRSRGALRAEAVLADSQINDIQSLEKGEVTVSCMLTDEEGIEPVLAEVVWAWVPKRS